MSLKSFLYKGKIEHRRFAPRGHEFSYNVCYYFLDLQEVPKIFNRPFLFSFNKPGILSFWRKDYFGNPEVSLDESVRKLVFEKSGEHLTGPIRILTNISYFGFCFNPVSFYYCYDDQENLKYVMSEVTNTPWKERHQHFFTFSGFEKTTYRLEKDFHVSPFMPMDIDYTWVFNRPAETINVLMQNRNKGEQALLFDSTLELKRLPLTSLNIFLSFLQFPFVTFKTAIAIYWHALKLYFKVPFYDHPKLGDHK